MANGRENTLHLHQGGTPAYGRLVVDGGILIDAVDESPSAGNTVSSEFLVGL